MVYYTDLLLGGSSACMPTSIIHGTVQVEKIQMKAEGWLSQVEMEVERKKKEWVWMNR